MQIKRRKLVAIIFGVFTLVALTVLWLWFFDPFISAKRCKVVIPEANETLYFRTVAWGVAGGHWHVVLSPNRGLGRARAYDVETEYLFDHPDGLLYRINGKILEIHSHFGGQKPKRFESMVKVQIITYDYNPDWLRLHDSHKDIGLTDVYECANLQEP